jgi:hypothetical protein
MPASSINGCGAPSRMLTMPKTRTFEALTG